MTTIGPRRPNLSNPGIKTMARIARLIGISLAALTHSLCAQYNTLPSTQTFASIANAPGAVALTNISGTPGCLNCTESVPVSFQFPWFRDAPKNNIWVGSNGAIWIDSQPTSPAPTGFPLALDNGQAGGFPGLNPARARIAVIHGALGPNVGGAIWVLDNGTSVIVSYEAVRWQLAIGTSVSSAQAEIFANGDIEIRYGSINTSLPPLGITNISSGLSEPGTGTTAWFSPAPIVPEFNGFGQTTNGVAPQNTGVLFSFSFAPNYQVNTPVASLDINGVAATADIPAVTMSCAGLLNTLNVNTSTPGALGDMAVSLQSVIPLAYTTTGLQTVNLDIAFPLIWLSGGATIAPQPFFPFTFQIVPFTSFTASAQALVTDPTNPDGISLSQASQISTPAGGTNGPQALPSTNNTPQLIAFSSFPMCGPASVPFYGTSYTELYVSPNGRLLFGNPSSDWSPTVFEARVQVPFFGLWTDFRPSPTSSNSVEVTPTGITATYSNVAFGNLTGSSNSLSLTIDLSGTCSIDLSGITVNTSTTILSGYAQFLGISRGLNMAVDAGTTTFAAGASGAPTAPNDMIYDYLSSPAILSSGGLLPSTPALQAGLGILTFLPTATGDSYTWSRL